MKRDLKGSQPYQPLRTYHLQICSVKMKVKFQCKMKVDHNNEPVTSEVSHQGNHIYMFNQDITLSEDNTPSNLFTLSINLVTSKGAKYIAALAYLQHTDLIRHLNTGQRSNLKVPLSKCLDAEAFMEVIVKEITTTGTGLKKRRSPSTSQRRKLKTETEINGHNKTIGAVDQLGTPTGKNISAAKSQLNFASSFYIAPTEKDKHKTQLKKGRGDSFDRKKGLISSRTSMGLYTPLHSRSFVQEQIEQNGLNRSHSRCGSISRLRDRLRKEQIHSVRQHEKRMSLQKSQNASKLEALKYRLRFQEMEKDMSEKRHTISRMEERIDSLQQMLRQTNRSNPLSQTASFSNLIVESPRVLQDPAIMMLQSKVECANSELEQLKARMLKMNRHHSEKQLALCKQLEAKKLTIKSLENQLCSLKTSLSYRGSNQSQEATASIENKNRIIGELQNQIKDLMSRLSQLEKGKRVGEQTNIELMNKIEILTRNQVQQENERSRMLESTETIKNRLNVSELTISTQKRNIEKLQTDLIAANKVKDKHNQTLVELKRVEGDRKLQQKHYEDMIKTINANLVSLQQKYNADVQNLDRKNKQLQGNLMSNIQKNREMENHILPNLKKELEQQKRIAERMQKEIENGKGSEKKNIKEIQNLSTKLTQVNGELEIHKNKLKSFESIYKAETEKLINETKKYKENLQQQLMKNLSLSQKNKTLTTDCSILQNKVKNLEEKIQEETMRAAKAEEKLKQYEELSKKQQQTNQELGQKQRKLIEKIQQYGQNQGSYSDLIRQYEKQVENWQMQLRRCQEKLEFKTQELKKLQQIHKEVNSKYVDASNQLQNLTLQHRKLSFDFQKMQKGQEQIEYHLAQNKMALENKERAIQKLKVSADEEQQKKTSANEELIKLSMNHEHLQKENQRFKSHLYTILLKQFSDGLENIVAETSHKQSLTRQSPHKFGTSMSTNKDASHISPKRLNFQSGESFYAASTSLSEPSNSDIIAMVNQFLKQSKNVTSKLAQECRLLEDENQRVKANVSNDKETYLIELERKDQIIRSLEDQLETIENAKNAIESDLIKKIARLETNNESKQAQLSQKQKEIESLIFTVEKLKIDEEEQINNLNCCVKEKTNIIQRLESNLEEVHIKYSQQENLLNQRQALLQESNDHNKRIEGQLAEQKQKITQQNQQIHMKNKLIEENKSKNKSLLSLIGELQLKVANQQEKSSKHAQLMEQEEKKFTDTKDFMNNLIKQKQALVKQDIYNSQKIIELQGENTHIKNQNNNLQESVKELQKVILEEKQGNKRLNKKIKTGEQHQSMLQDNIQKLEKQIKGKEQQLNILNQKMKNMIEENEREIQKCKKQKFSLKEEIDLNTKVNQQEVSNLKNQIKKLEEDLIPKIRQEAKMIRNSLQIANRELDLAQQQINEKNFEINLCKQSEERAMKNSGKLQNTIEKLENQLTEKNMRIYQLSSQLYNLQQIYSQKVQTNEQSLQKMEQQFGYKEQSMMEDYETRIDDLERERDYFKSKLAQTQEDVSKLNQKITELENQQRHIRLQLKQKLIRTQEEKTSAIAKLKSQIKRLMEEKNSLDGQKKKVELNLDTLSKNGQVLKQTIQNYQKTVKQYEEKNQALQKGIQAQMERHKKKDFVKKQLEDKINTYQWTLERQIKKQIQNLAKQILNKCGEKGQKRNIMECMKECEGKLVKLLGREVITHSNLIN